MCFTSILTLANVGNELSGGGIGARVEAAQYAKDLIILKRIMTELYWKSSFKPKLVAPGGFYDKNWFNQLLQDSGSGVVNIVTYHIYNLGPGMQSWFQNSLTIDIQIFLYSLDFEQLTFSENFLFPVIKT